MGRKKSTLLDQAAHPQVLAAAFQEIRSGKGSAGVDGVSVETFGNRLEASVQQLSRELRGGWYAPLPVRRFFIPKADQGRRAIGIPAVRDRVVGRALQRSLTPCFNKRFCRHSYAYRKGRSARGAVQQVCRHLRSGGSHATLIDIRDFFPSVDQALLLEFLDEILKQDPVVPVIGAIMAAGFVEERGRHAPRGLEQGNPLSPLLSNVYLHPFDVALTQRSARWVRYSDNAVVVCSSHTQAEEELDRIRGELAKLHLGLNNEKSQVADAEAGFPFLGYHLSSSGVGPDVAAVKRLRESLSTLQQKEAAGMSARARIRARKAVLQGWLNYYSSLSGLPVVDGYTLAAALELAGQRGDQTGARALLKAEVEGEVYPEEAEVVRAAAIRAGVPPEFFEEAGEGAKRRDSALEGTGYSPSASIDARGAARGSSVPAALEGLEYSPSPPVDAWGAACGSSAPAARKAPPGTPDNRATRALGLHSGPMSTHGKPFSIRATDPPLASPGETGMESAAARGLGSENFPACDWTQAEALLSSGDYARAREVVRSVEREGQQALGVERKDTRQAAKESDRDHSKNCSPSEIRITRGGLAALMIRFQGAKGSHARMWVDRKGRRGYAAVARPLTEAAWRAHLSGEETLALPICDGRKVHAGVLDVDLERLTFDRVKNDPSALQAGLWRTHQFALKLMQVARRQGLDPLLEDSGRKGRHVWFFFEPAAPVRSVHRLLRNLIADAGPLPDGLSCETIPGSSRAPGSEMAALVTLPLGIHKVTNRRSLLLNADGSAVTDIERVVGGVRCCGDEQLRLALGGTPPEEELSAPMCVATDPRINEMLSHCPVIARLVDKACAVGHLNHLERMALLCTVGHFGDAGRDFLHRAISKCGNYDRRITQKRIDRLKSSPVSCARIREWLPETVKQVSCSCRFSSSRPKSQYPTPVLHAVQE